MKASDYYDNMATTLGQAEEQANTEWEMEFVSSLVDKHIQYGDDMLLSEKQYEALERILNQ